MRTEDRRSNPHKSNWRSEFFNKLLVLCPGNTLTKSLELGEDGIRGGGPGERLGLDIVVMDETLNVGNQLVNAAEGSAADRLLGNDVEPDFHLIEPGRIGRGEVQVVTRASSQ